MYRIFRDYFIWAIKDTAQILERVELIFCHIVINFGSFPVDNWDNFNIAT